VASCRRGGYIAFHDIKDSDFHRSQNVGVARLWGELPGRKIEFNAGLHLAGIGLLQVG
jgi:hypothetical protein